MERPIAALLVVVAGAVLVGAQADSDAVTVVSPAGRERLAVVAADGVEMLALDELARLLQLEVREDPRAGTLSVTGAGGSLIMTPGQQIVSVDGRLVSLRAAPRQQAGRWLVPLDLINRGLAQVADQRVELNLARRRLLLGEVRVTRITARYRPAADQARLSLELAPAVAHEVTRGDSELRVAFDADVVDVEQPPELRGGLATAFDVTDDGVVIHLGPEVDSYDVSRQPAGGGGATLEIELMARRSAPADVQPAATPPLPTRTDLLPEFTVGPAVRLAVIDPGHGGNDTGSQGAAGTLEKDITLAVARKLRDAIENRIGLRVILTRERDEAVALDTRAAIANNNKADLFISLHLNASTRPAAVGATVYYLSIDEYDDEAREVASRRMQPVPVVGGGSREIDLVNWETAQIRYVSQSGRLASTLEAALAPRILLSPQPVRQAPLRVLVGANMPAALVELGSLSDPDAEARLATAAYQDDIVDALVSGIRRYADDLGRARQFAPRLPATESAGGRLLQAPPQ